MKQKTAILGGDRRQTAAAEELKKYGVETVLYGFDTYGDIDGITLSEALDGADTVLLPVPAFTGNILNVTYSDKPAPTVDTVLKSIPDTVTLVCGGMLPTALTEELAKRNTEVFDLCGSERFNLLNAVPTAEGAIELAMTHLPVTLCGSRAIVIGCGRIGRLLCRMLKALGASVIAVSRSEKDLTLSEIEGCTPCSMSSLADMIPDADVIFNTVPAVILTGKYLSLIDSDTPIIDLASRPGGVETASALKYGNKVITALSLPGKVAPVSAGRIIASCLTEKLAEADRI